MAATKGLMDHLFMAACEWFLMFWVFIDAALASSLTKFAQYCEIQIPCVLCSRLDQFFGNEKLGSYLNLFCNKHQTDISYWIFCDLHNKLVDVREMCENCLSSLTSQSQFDLEPYRLLVGAIGREKEGYRRSYFDNNFLCVSSCSCCKRKWKAKPGDQGMFQPNAADSRASKVTTKPPLPNVARRGRSRHQESSKKMRNKVKHRRVNDLSPVGFSGVSDSEFEFLFSDDDDGYFNLVGIGERNWKGDSITNGGRILGKHSYSTSDIGTALLEAQLNESLRTRTRSASLTPNVMQFLRKTQENDILKAAKDKKPSSVMNSKKVDSLTDARNRLLASLDKSDGRLSSDGSVFPGSQNRCPIFSRHSYSASDLRSALLLEMQHDRTLPRRSASLTPTPTSSSGYGLGEFKRQKVQGRRTHSSEPNVPPKFKRSKRSSSSTSSIKRSGSSTDVRSDLPMSYLERTRGHGSLDGSVVSRNTRNHNRRKIPRRHSYSTFEVGCALLLEMHQSERSRARSASLTPNCIIGLGLEETMKSISQTRSGPSFTSGLNFPSTGSMDDSAVSHNRSSRNQDNNPRRHSCCVFQMGCEILLNMPTDESLTSRSASLAPNSSIGHGLEESKKSKFQTGPSHSHSPELPPMGSVKRFNSSSDVRKSKWHGSLDDSVVSRRTTASQNQNKIPRRHSVSAFDALLVEMHFGETNHSASLAPNGSIGHGLGEPNKSQFQTGPISSHSLEFKSINLVQMPQRKVRRVKRSRPSMNSIEGLGTSSDVRGDSKAVSNKQRGSLDDSVVSRNVDSHDKNKNPRRHSYTAFELGCAVLMHHMEEGLKRRSASVTPNGSIFNGSGEPNKSKSHTRPSPRLPELDSLNAGQFPKQKRETDGLPPVSSVDRFGPSSSEARKSKWHGSLDDSVVSHSTRSQNQNEIPRRHSLSAFDLGRALCIEMQLAESSKSGNASTQHRFEELNWLKLQNRPSGNSSELNYVEFHHRKAMKDNRLGTSSDVRSDLSTISLDNSNVCGSWDDSVVSRNTGSRNQNNSPRRHSCSVFHTGREILLNMPVDESLTSRSSSLAPKGSTGHGLEEPKKTKHHTKPSSSHTSEHGLHKPPTGAVKRVSSSSDVRSDLSTSFLDKTKWRGSLDDLIISPKTGSQNQNAIPRRHSYSAFDLGRALLVGMHLDESLRRCNASLQPNSSTEHGFGEHNQSKFQNKPGHSSEHSSHNVRKAKRDMKPMPLPSLNNKLSSSSDVTSDLLTASFCKIDGFNSLDDSVVIRRTSGQTQYQNPRRHSYSAYEIVCAPLLDIYCDERITGRSAGHGSHNAHHKPEGNHHKNHKKDEHLPPMHPVIGLGSSSDGNDQNRHMNLGRNSYSTSDLQSPLPEMHLDEGLTSRSASLTPDCSIGQGLGDLKGLKFQTGINTSSQEFGYLDAMRSPRRKRKKHDSSKTKKNKKSLASANNVKVMSSSTNSGSDLPASSLDKTNWFGSFDDSVISNDMDRRNRYKTFSRHSQSATDLRSLETHTDEGPRRRSASMTPDCSTGHGFGESEWSTFQTAPASHSPELNSLNAVQFPVEETKKRDPHEVAKDKPPLHPVKEMDFSTNIRSEMCPHCSDRSEAQSMAGSSVSELELDGTVKMKQRAEEDLRCMRLLQSELEAERNAATVAAHHAMNMITRLQQEKASLQMEALQYLRMMEEQAEYDMEALQKANELVEEKENEIQDLLEELEHYRRKYGDESTRNILAPVKSLEDEKRYVLQSLSTLEKKLIQLSSGMSNGDPYAKNKEKVQLDPLKDENSLLAQKDSSISNGVHDKPLEIQKLVDSGKKLVGRDGGEVDLATMEHEIAYLKEKMEIVEADLDFLKHACNTLHASEGFEFIEEIAHQLQDLRRFMLDRKYISSN